MPEKKKGFDLAAALAPVSNLNTGNQDRPQLEYIDIDLTTPKRWCGAVGTAA